MKDIPVKDALAAERTVLAAERTFLAYVRTAFAIQIAGFTGVHFLSTPFLKTASYVTVGIGLVVFAFGAWRFIASRAHTRRVVDQLKAESLRPPSG